MKINNLNFYKKKTIKISLSIKKKDIYIILVCKYLFLIVLIIMNICHK